MKTHPAVRYYGSAEVCERPHLILKTLARKRAVTHRAKSASPLSLPRQLWLLANSCNTGNRHIRFLSLVAERTASDASGNRPSSLRTASLRERNGYSRRTMRPSTG